jgi:hypothetical protein
MPQMNFARQPLHQQAIGIASATLTWALLLVMPTAGPARAITDPSTAVPSGSVLYWGADFETGDLSQWDFVQDQTHDNAADSPTLNSVVAVRSSPTRAGRWVGTLTTNPTANDQVSANLIAFDPNAHGLPGQDAYYGWSSYFPLSNKGNWTPNSWDWNTFQEFIHPNSNFSVPAGMGINTGVYGVDYPHINWSLNVASDGSQGDRAGGYWEDPNPMVYDTWYDFVMHVNWASDSTGLIELWMNGTKVVGITGHRTLPNIASSWRPGDGLNLEMMNYHGPNPHTLTILLDQVRVGSSYSAVAP